MLVWFISFQIVGLMAPISCWSLNSAAFGSFHVGTVHDLQLDFISCTLIIKVASSQRQGIELVRREGDYTNP